MISTAVLRSMWRRTTLYINKPIFDRSGRSLKDFLLSTFMFGLKICACFLLLVTLLLLTDEGGMTGYGNCGSPKCIEQ